MIEDAGGNFRRQRPAPLVDLVDPKSLRRGIYMPAKQALDARFNLRLQVGASCPVERDRCLDRFRLRPAARDAVKGEALPRNGRISEPGSAVQPVCSGRRVELAGEGDQIFLAAFACKVDEQRRPFEVVAGFGPAPLFARGGVPVVIEIFAKGPTSASKKWLRKRSMMRAARRR